MRKLRLWFLIFIFLFILPISVYAQPYLCGSTGLIYSDQNFCNSACGATCQDLTATSNGTSYACPTSGYEGFVYNPNTGYTYAVTTNTQFWTYFDAQSNDPSLVIIPDAATNTALSQILTYYNIQEAWIGAYDPSMSTSYNVVDPQNYSWWNNSAINYTNWASGQPNNLLNSQDIGVVPTEGNHWAYMSSNGEWYANGYHYNYPASQNYAPYYNALVQWNGPLSCVNGVTSPSQPITQPDITTATNQYCNGATPCYMCTDTSQCTPQNECSSGYTYNATNNDCESSPICPSGGTLNSTSGSCETQASIACPNNYTYNATNKDCEAQASPSCNASGSISNGQCVLTPNNGCNSYYSYNTTNNDCEAYASAQCANGGTAETVNGQTMCQLSPTYSCADSSYAYNTLVSGQCAASANIQCPPGGSYSGGQCVSTTSPCPSGYTQNGGLCTAPATITCPGSGTYSDIYGDCIEPTQSNCPTGFTLDSSTHYCEGTPTGYTCPGSGNYDDSESMCSEPVVLGCPTGYSLVSNQCVSPINYSCPLPGSYNSVENACSASVTSYNCPTGYTYANNKCEASPSCSTPGSYSTAENACSAPLQPCSPTNQNMQQCTQTSMGYLCPLKSVACTPNSGNNNFTNGGIISPSVYKTTYVPSNVLSSNWISTVSGDNDANNGYMSFYNYNDNLPAGTYRINFSSDDNGWLYINDKQITSNVAFPIVSSVSWTSSGGPANFFIAVMNNSQVYSSSPNPTGTYLSVVNSSGATVFTTNTNWQASLNPSNFGYSATCPSGFTWNEGYNACVVNADSGNNSFINSGVVSPSAYNSSGWISITGANSTNNGAVSFYNANTYDLPAGTYTINFATDDDGWLYVNGNYIMSGVIAGSTTSWTWTSNDGTANFTIGLMNNCPNCPATGNPTGAYLSVVNSSGATVFTTNTNWQASYNPRNFGLDITCPSGYSWNGSYNACIASPISGTTCPNGGAYSQMNGYCYTIPYVYGICPQNSYYSQYGNFCYIAPSISFSDICPLGNYPCMPNGNNGYSCSSLTCANVNNVQQEPVPVSNNPTNNGTVTDQGCSGTIYIFNGQTFDCREPGIEDGFADCCASKKDWIGMGKCWQNEVELQQKKSAGFCHYVGTFCTAKFLGVCLQKDRAYCCFDGVLARIIQEQGRLQSLPQAGWGSAKSPDCEGFTPTQFQQLDWSKINLSEYYAYIEQQFVPQMQQKVNNAVNNMANKLQQGYSSQ